MASLLRIQVLAGPPTTGLWCDTCALPSCASYELSAATDTGLIPLPPQTVCDRCTDPVDAARARAQAVAAAIGGTIVETSRGTDR